MTTIRKGNRYTHDRMIYADAAHTPMTVQVTKIQNGIVYYRLVVRYCIGTPEEREADKLGSLYWIDLAKAEQRWTDARVPAS